MVSVRPSSYGCTWEVLNSEKLESHLAITSCDSYASLVLSNLPRTYITGRTHTNHEPIAKCKPSLSLENNLYFNIQNAPIATQFLFGKAENERFSRRYWPLIPLHCSHGNIVRKSSSCSWFHAMNVKWVHIFNSFSTTSKFY